MPPKRKHSATVSEAGSAVPPPPAPSSSSSSSTSSSSSSSVSAALPSTTLAKSTTTTTTTVTTSSAAAVKKEEDLLLEESPSKKAKLHNEEHNDDDSEEDKKKKMDQQEEEGEEGGDTEVDEDDDDEEEEDDRPVCWYGANCYRKNPQHFKEYKHPHVDDKPKKQTKKAAPAKKSAAPKAAAASAPSSTPPAPAAAAAVPASTAKPAASAPSASDPSKEAYRCVVQVILAKNKITPDEKRILRGFRRTHNVSDQTHTEVLKEFGWTDDEYEDGERKDDDIEVDEEIPLLEGSGFGYIKLSKSRKMTSQQEAVFSKVAAHFYQTMSKAQANYAIKEVWIIVNRDLKDKYNVKKSELTALGRDVNEVLAFHGTSRSSVEGISKTGFLPPTKLPSEKAKPKATKITKKSTKKKIITKKGKKIQQEEEEIDIEVLDDGFFGKGIYFSIYSDYAMWYSDERGSDQILLCKVMKGKTFRCEGRMDGEGRQTGYDSHSSPKGNEIIIFEPDQILPRYVVSFESKEAEEREQEG